MRDNKAESTAWYKRVLDWDNSENIHDADTIRQIGDWYHRAADFFNDAGAILILADIYRKKSERYSTMEREIDFFGFLTEEENEH